MSDENVAGISAALDDAFNTDRERTRLNQIPGNKHSLLTVHFIDKAGSTTDKALGDVMQHFGEKLSA